MKNQREMNDIQKYFENKSKEKARLRNVLVNGNRATVIFLEHNVPESDIEELQKYDAGSDGHYYYIRFCIWNGSRSYWNDKEISTAYNFLTTKAEGNQIYKQLKETGKYNVDLSV